MVGGTTVMHIYLYTSTALVSRERGGKPEEARGMHRSGCRLDTIFILDIVGTI
jgi:hypothetical protein